MIVGIPKEIKANEFRVGLVPASVRELTRRGHQVLIEYESVARDLGLEYTPARQFVEAAKGMGGLPA